MIHTPAPPCNCNGRKAPRMGDATDGTFSDFLAANPDAAAAVTNYRSSAAGASDPVLQTFYYNPVTGITAPGTMPAQSPGDTPTGTAAAIASSSATSSAFLGITPAMQQTLLWVLVAALATWTLFEVLEQPGRKKKRR
jgi:hypothetical protein